MLVDMKGVEPSACALGERRSIQLSYMSIPSIVAKNSFFVNSRD